MNAVTVVFQRCLYNYVVVPVTFINNVKQENGTTGGSCTISKNTTSEFTFNNSTLTSNRYTGSAEYTCPILLSSTANTGYAFSGWYTDENCTSSNLLAVSSSHQISVQATDVAGAENSNTIYAKFINDQLSLTVNIYIIYSTDPSNPIADTDNSSCIFNINSVRVLHNTLLNYSNNTTLLFSLTPNTDYSFKYYTLQFSHTYNGSTSGSETITAQNPSIIIKSTGTLNIYIDKTEPNKRYSLSLNVVNNTDASPSASFILYKDNTQLISINGNGSNNVIIRDSQLTLSSATKLVGNINYGVNHYNVLATIAGTPINNGTGAMLSINDMFASTTAVGSASITLTSPNSSTVSATSGILYSSETATTLTFTIDRFQDIINLSRKTLILQKNVEKNISWDILSGFTPSVISSPAGRVTITNISSTGCTLLVNDIYTDNIVITVSTPALFGTPEGSHQKMWKGSAATLTIGTSESSNDIRVVSSFNTSDTTESSHDTHTKVQLTSNVRLDISEIENASLDIAHFEAGSTLTVTGKMQIESAFDYKDINYTGELTTNDNTSIIIGYNDTIYTIWQRKKHINHVYIYDFTYNGSLIGFNETQSDNIEWDTQLTVSHPYKIGYIYEYGVVHAAELSISSINDAQTWYNNNTLVSAFVNKSALVYSKRNQTFNVYTDSTTHNNHYLLRKRKQYVIHQYIISLDKNGNNSNCTAENDLSANWDYISNKYYYEKKTVDTAEFGDTWSTWSSNDTLLIGHSFVKFELHGNADINGVFNSKLGESTDDIWTFVIPDNTYALTETDADFTNLYIVAYYKYAKYKIVICDLLCMENYKSKLSSISTVSNLYENRYLKTNLNISETVPLLIEQEITHNKSNTLIYYRDEVTISINDSDKLKDALYVGYEFYNIYYKKNDNSYILNTTPAATNPTHENVPHNTEDTLLTFFSTDIIESMPGEHICVFRAFTRAKYGITIVTVSGTADGNILLVHNTVSQDNITYYGKTLLSTSLTINDSISTTRYYNVNYILHANEQTSENYYINTPLGIDHIGWNVNDYINYNPNIIQWGIVKKPAIDNTYIYKVYLHCGYYGVQPHTPHITIYNPTNEDVMLNNVTNVQIGGNQNSVFLYIAATKNDSNNGWFVVADNFDVGKTIDTDGVLLEPLYGKYKAACPGYFNAADKDVTLQKLCQQELICQHGAAASTPRNMDPIPYWVKFKCIDEDGFEVNTAISCTMKLNGVTFNLKKDKNGYNSEELSPYFIIEFDSKENTTELGKTLYLGEYVIYGNNPLYGNTSNSMNIISGDKGATNISVIATNYTFVGPSSDGTTIENTAALKLLLNSDTNTTDVTYLIFHADRRVYFRVYSNDKTYTHNVGAPIVNIATGTATFNGVSYIIKNYGCGIYYIDIPYTLLYGSTTSNTPISGVSKTISGDAAEKIILTNISISASGFNTYTINNITAYTYKNTTDIRYGFTTSNTYSVAVPMSCSQLGIAYTVKREGLSELGESLAQSTSCNYVVKLYYPGARLIESNNHYSNVVFANTASNNNLTGTFYDIINSTKSINKFSQFTSRAVSNDNQVITNNFFNGNNFCLFNIISNDYRTGRNSAVESDIHIIKNGSYYNIMKPNKDTLRYHFINKSTGQILTVKSDPSYPATDIYNEVQYESDNITVITNCGVVSLRTLLDTWYFGGRFYETADYITLDNDGNIGSETASTADFINFAAYYNTNYGSSVYSSNYTNYLSITNISSNANVQIKTPSKIEIKPYKMAINNDDIESYDYNWVFPTISKQNNNYTVIGAVNNTFNSNIKVILSQDGTKALNINSGGALEVISYNNDTATVGTGWLIAHSTLYGSTWDNDTVTGNGIPTISIKYGQGGVQSTNSILITAEYNGITDNVGTLYYPYKSKTLYENLQDNTFDNYNILINRYNFEGHYIKSLTNSLTYNHNDIITGVNSHIIAVKKNRGTDIVGTANALDDFSQDYGQSTAVDCTNYNIYNNGSVVYSKIFTNGFYLSHIKISSGEIFNDTSHMAMNKYRALNSISAKSSILVNGNSLDLYNTTAISSTAGIECALGSNISVGGHILKTSLNYITTDEEWTGLEDYYNVKQIYPQMYSTASGYSSDILIAAATANSAHNTPGVIYLMPKTYFISFTLRLPNGEYINNITHNTSTFNSELQTGITNFEIYINNAGTNKPVKYSNNIYYLENNSKKYYYVYYIPGCTPLTTTANNDKPSVCNILYSWQTDVTRNRYNEQHYLTAVSTFNHTLSDSFNDIVSNSGIIDFVYNPWSTISKGTNQVKSSIINNKAALEVHAPVLKTIDPKIAMKFYVLPINTIKQKLYDLIAYYCFITCTTVYNKYNDELYCSNKLIPCESKTLNTVKYRGNSNYKISSGCSAINYDFILNKTTLETYLITYDVTTVRNYVGETVYDILSQNTVNNVFLLYNDILNTRINADIASARIYDIYEYTNITMNGCYHYYKNL